MPKRQVAQISHAALTNHRIPAQATDARPFSEPGIRLPDLPGLVLLDGSPYLTSLPIVTRLAAYGELMAQDRGLETEYLRLLAAAAAANPGDKLVLAALGRKALLEGKAAVAVDFLGKAEAHGGLSSVSYVDLADALAKVNRADDARHALERAQALYPFSQPIRKRLILSYIQAHQYSQAKLALEQYVADFPEDSFMRGLLEKVTGGK
jgi:tetratricopeptide (TPR) repeat protein